MASRKLIVVLMSLLVACEAIKFEIQGGSSKCLGEEIGKGTLVVGEYKVVEASAPAVEKVPFETIFAALVVVLEI